MLDDPEAIVMATVKPELAVAVGVYVPATTGELGDVEVRVIVCVAVSVAGNTAMSVPEFAECVTDVAPVTVKKLAVTPVSVKPDPAVSVIVAVYEVPAANVEGVPDQVTVPVYPFAAVTVVTGVALLTGAVTPAIAGT